MEELSRDVVEDVLVRMSVVARPDLVQVTPPDERHFDPISVAVVFGGVLVSAFLRGFTEQWKGDAEELGRKTGTWLDGRLKALFSRPADGEDRVTTATTEVRDDAVRAARAVPDELERVHAAESVKRALALVLVFEWDFPADRADSLAEEVRAHATELLGAVRSATAS